MWNFDFANGDVRKGPGSRVLQVRNLEKAWQQLAHMLGTSGVDQLIGTVPLSAWVLRAEISRQIQGAFEAVYTAHRRIQFSRRTPEETFMALARLEVTQPPVQSDVRGPTTVRPTAYRVYTQVQTGSSKPVDLRGSLLPVGTLGPSTTAATGRGRRVVVN